MDADAFVLILGLWYGWIPSGYDNSITHLEFKWARERRADTRYPRVLVVAPYVGGETWRELRKNADRYLDGLDFEARQHHKVLIDAFHKETIGGNRTGESRRDWRIVTYYNNELDLFHSFKEVMAEWQRGVLIEGLAKAKESD
jgi:hypothetical protein